MVNILKQNEWMTYVRSHCKDAGITLQTNTLQPKVDMKNKIIYCPVNEIKIPASAGSQKKVFLQKAIESGYTGWFIKHEMAHLLYSKPFEDMIDQNAPDRQRLFFVTNAFEDIRVNNKLSEKYVGISEEFVEMYDTHRQHLKDKIKQNGGKLQYNAKNIAYIMSDYVNKGKSEFVEEGLVDDKIAQFFKDHREKVYNGFVKSKETDDIVKLAKSLLKYIEKEPEQPEQPQDQKGDASKGGGKNEGDQEEGGKGSGKSDDDKDEKEDDKSKGGGKGNKPEKEDDKDEQENDGSEDNSDDDDTNEQQKKDEPNDKDKGADGNDDGGTDEQSDNSEQNEEKEEEQEQQEKEEETDQTNENWEDNFEDEPEQELEQEQPKDEGDGEEKGFSVDPDIGEFVKSQLSHLNKQLMSSEYRDSVYKYSGKVVTFKGRDLKDDKKLTRYVYGGRRNYSEQLKEDPIIINKVKRILMDYLINEERNRTLFNFKKGKLSTRHLFRVSTDKINPRVFKKKFMGKENNVDLMILLDYSDSMNCGNKIINATNFTFNLNRALKDIKEVNYNITAYTTSQNMGYDQQTQTVLTDNHHFIFKDFGERFDEEGAKYVLDTNNNALTNDYEALKWATREIKKQKNKRKIIFVVCDGCPQVNNVSSTLMEKLTKEQVEYCRKVGIEVYAFGINAWGIEAIYGKGNYIHVDSKTIAQTIGTELLKLLTKGGK